MKVIERVRKGANTLADFCATLNLSRRGLHHKTFSGHIDIMVYAYQAAVKATETESVPVAKVLYQNFLNP
ncbi:hypothetical protein HPB47_016820, partial [Ixodes persulcatus]